MSTAATLPRAAQSAPGPYRGRLAPSPTGYLHVGHARTFWTAQQRCRDAGGTLVLRNEDLDRDRCRPEFVAAMFEDLRWFGFDWQEGPDLGGPFAPYSQSERMPLYRDALEKLYAANLIYPCSCSRQDVLRALNAPHAGDSEPLYPGTCRDLRRPRLTIEELRSALAAADNSAFGIPPGLRINWRFRVPDSQAVSFNDGHYGLQQFVAGKVFGDFIVWRHDQVPSYQLAVVTDDDAMRITEVVRGADLLDSTARQILLYRALDLKPPQFFHCPLVTDEAGKRLAKRHDALSLRELRRRGESPEAIRKRWPDSDIYNCRLHQSS